MHLQLHTHKNRGVQIQVELGHFCANIEPKLPSFALGDSRSFDVISVTCRMSEGNQIQMAVWYCPVVRSLTKLKWIKSKTHYSRGCSHFGWKWKLQISRLKCYGWRKWPHFIVFERFHCCECSNPWCVREMVEDNGSTLLKNHSRC